MGPKWYLTYEEESELVKFIIKCSKMGYGKTRQDMMKLVESCLAKKDLKRKSNKLAVVIDTRKHFEVTNMYKLFSS